MNSRVIRPAEPPIDVDALLDDLVLDDLHAICDRTGLSLVEVLDIATRHLAPDDLRGFEPVVDLTHWDRRASYPLGDPGRAHRGED